MSVDPLLEAVERFKPPDVLPSDEQIERQRQLLQSHIASYQYTIPRRRWGSALARMKKFATMPLVIVVTLLVGAGGSSIGWAVSDSTSPAPAPTYVTYTVCSAPGPTGDALTFVIVGNSCTGGLPSYWFSMGLSPRAPKHVYCAPKGDPPTLENVLLLWHSEVCPTSDTAVDPHQVST